MTLIAACSSGDENSGDLLESWFVDGLHAVIDHR
jgi:hypothetical protein